MSDSKAVVLGEAKSASSSGPSEASVHVDSMAVRLLGVALGMVLLAASAAGLHAEFAADAGRCTGELQRAGSFMSVDCMRRWSSRPNNAQTAERACVLFAAWLH